MPFSVQWNYQALDLLKIISFCLKLENKSKRAEGRKSLLFPSSQKVSRRATDCKLLTGHFHILQLIDQLVSNLRSVNQTHVFISRCFFLEKRMQTLCQRYDIFGR